MKQRHELHFRLQIPLSYLKPTADPAQNGEYQAHKRLLHKLDDRAVWIIESDNAAPGIRARAAGRDG